MSDNNPSCRLLIDPPAAGAWNMAVDEALLDMAAEGRAALRFYQWNEATLSLGYFQHFEQRAQHAASRCCAAVRRLTGGGAIVHDRELTYSLALPRGLASADDRDRLYSLAHRSLLAALAEKGIRAEVFCLCPPAGAASETAAHGPLRLSSVTIERAGSNAPSNQTGSPGGQAGNDSFAPGNSALSCEPADRHEEAFLCFQRRTPGDVILGGMKIAGSAQRRRRGAVLQHGSVLLARSSAAPELPGIAEISGIDLSPLELVECWQPLLARAMGLNVTPQPLSAEERLRVESLVGLRYANRTWTERRENSGA